MEVLRADLHKLLAAYRESDHALASTAPRPRVRVSGNRPAKGIVLDERIVALRAQIAETLASWARLVVDEARSPKPDRCEVACLVHFLSRHVDWLAAHPAAADFNDEISRLLESCNTVLGPGAVQRTPIGRCPEPGCSSTLEVVTRTDSGQPPRQIVCESGHALPPREWLRFMGRFPTTMSQNGSLPLAAEGARP
ncbi:hypothetical protein ACFSL4_15120 [Streptomyces caeni]|uniref:Uncharacterized protein n=1 Tax=Streptomyces caeni TaxID=2307231 RepID=A0ABW4ISH0_9ACTN